MKVLWLCNIMLPIIAKELGQEASNKEGWLTGLSEQLLSHAGENGIELGICFPVGKNQKPVKGQGKNFSYFGFCEDTTRAEEYDEAIEPQLAAIVEEFAPDVIHVFGTEYPHTLAMTRCIEDKSRLLIGLQGLCSECAKVYTAGLPDKVQKRWLFRDFVKNDNIVMQQRKFARRGENEIEAIKNAGHITGRTEWDKAVVEGINPKVQYHFMNETLRPVFYDALWNYSTCEKYSIFLSQGDYPLKGLHFFLQAMPAILERYPDTKAYVAGDVITKYGTWKEKLKIGSYGKYCRELIKKYHLENKIVFLGRLNSKEMCRQYLKSHVFLSASALENSPNSVGEAMLLGMPVISSMVGGVPSMLTDKKEGLLYPYQDIHKLAETVCTMFAETPKATEYGKAARERALVTHDPEKNYKRLLEIYAELQ